MCAALIAAAVMGCGGGGDTPPAIQAAVCQVAIGNAVAYVSGAPACTTAYLNDDSGTAMVTSVATPSGVIPYTFGSLATCTGLGAPPGVGDLMLVPCMVKVL